MIIDFHNHIGKSMDGPVQTLEGLKKNMRKNGVTKSVIFPTDDVRRISPVEISMELLEKTKNDKFMLPFLRFDPKRMSPEKLEEMLGIGFYGVKLHSRAENFEPLDRRFFPIYRVIESSGKPLLFHVKKYHIKRADPERIVKIARHFPKLKLVLAHFANSQPRVFEYVKKHKLRNVYFDTSVSATEFYLKKVIKMLGSGRILFGSDSPFSDQEVELLKIKKLDTPLKAKQDILSGNAKRILGL